jgi:hypothetical protein
MALAGPAFAVLDVEAEAIADNSSPGADAPKSTPELSIFGHDKSLGYSELLEEGVFMKRASLAS